MKKYPPLVFFGSGPVALKSLEFISKHFIVESVITKPQAPLDKKTPPVISWCQKNKIRYLTPKNKSGLDEIFSNHKFDSRLGVLVDFGIIVSEEVINYFPLGIINSHFSLLPKWRGADPITFSILEGDKKTGVSLMLIDRGMDTGLLLAQKEYPIRKSITTPVLTEELISLSNQMLLDFLPKYTQGAIKPYPQSRSVSITYSKKINKSDGYIDWNKTAEQIEREIRAYTFWPGSKTEIFGRDVTITKARALPGNSSPGKVEVNRSAGLLNIYCKKGYLSVEKLKPASKNEMTASEFIRGYIK